MFAILLSEEMDPFYQNISSFPTVLFTLLLGVVMFYWGVAILGLVDIDILDFDMEGAKGEPSFSADSVHAAPSALAGLMLKLGLRDVPVTIIVSIIAIFGWFSCYFLVYFIFPFVPDGWMEYLIGIPILLGALFIGIAFASLAIKPLRPFFRKATAHTPKVLLGQTAIVRTSRVDNNFGEAVLEDGGAGLILKVRTSDEKVFKKNDKVVLFEYQKDKNIYFVISEDEFLN